MIVGVGKDVLEDVLHYAFLLRLQIATAIIKN